MSSSASGVAGRSAASTKLATMSSWLASICVPEIVGGASFSDVSSVQNCCGLTQLSQNSCCLFNSTVNSVCDCTSLRCVVFVFVNVCDCALDSSVCVSFVSNFFGPIACVYF